MNNPLFDEFGWFLGVIPQDCISDCVRPGEDAQPAVDYWCHKLDFKVPRQLAIDCPWLAEYGAWPIETTEYDKGLKDMSDQEIASKVLWIACCDITEGNSWFGLVH